MAQKDDATLLTQAGVIKAETTANANTATRVGTMMEDIIDSKMNNDDLIDEDDMSTNSATRPPSQQSVKAYVDAEIAGVGGGTIDATPTDGSSNAVQSNGVFDALALKAPLASPTFTGTPAAPTAAAATNTTQLATTAFVQSNSFAFTPADELTEIAGLSLESDITTAQLLEALAIPVIIPIHGNLTTGHTLTNMASALTAVGSNHYARPDTTNLRRMRLYCRVVTVSNSANTPRLFIQYSIDGGSNFITLGAGTVVSGDAIDLFTGAAGTQNTNWITIPAEARGSNFVWRIASQGGDGAADPVIGNCYIEAST